MANIDDVFREVVYNVGPPWRISCVDYMAVTGVVPRQESRDPNSIKKGMERAEKVPRTTAPEPSV
jgi:hypothetical protein